MTTVVQVVNNQIVVVPGADVGLVVAARLAAILAIGAAGDVEQAAVVATGTAQVALVEAEGAEQIASIRLTHGADQYASTADAVSMGVAGLSGLVAGSGGTNGTFALAFSGGGGSGAAGYFVVAGGAVTSAVITAKGRGYTSDPTVSFAASSGLTGASVTVNRAQNRTAGQYFTIPVTDGYQLYTVTTGTTTATVGGVMPNIAAVEALIDDATLGLPAMKDALYIYEPQTVTIVPNMRIDPTTGAVSAGSTYAYAKMALDGTEEQLKIEGQVTGGSRRLITWYSDTGCTTYHSQGTDLGGAAPGVLYQDGTAVYVVPPAGAQGIGVNSMTYGPLTIAVYKPIDAADRIEALETATETLPEIIDALYAWNPQSISIVAGSRIDPTTGAVSSGAGYSMAKMSLAGITGDIRVTGHVLGGTRRLVTWYSDTACTTYHSQGSELGAASGTVGTPYIDHAVTPPVGAQGMGVNSMADQELKIEVFEIVIDTPEAAAGGFAGKPWASFGDSNVDNGRWQATVSLSLGLGAHTECGQPGSRVAKPDVHASTAISMCDDTRINAIPSDAKLIIGMFGTNDHGGSIALGTLSAYGTTSFTNTTFIGGLEEVATKLLARFNTGQMIVFVTPAFVKRQDRYDTATWTDPYVNTAGLTIADYAQAVRDVAKKYGFPVVDQTARMGANSVNAAVFFDNESGSFIHHSAAVGGPRLGALIAGELAALEPTAAIL